MKYFIILVTSFFFFLGTGFLAYFLWDVEQGWEWKALWIFGPTFLGFLTIKNIQNYSKIQRDKNKLKVSKFLSTKTYDLNELISWSEETNLFRVSFRKVKLNFKGIKLTLIDHADPLNISELYHYLRTHYYDRMSKH